MTAEMASPNATFPQKLFILMENEPTSIVTWNANGISFRVVDTEKFSEEIIPKYFRHTKMASFQRQLNLYGFRRVTKGDDAGSYFHPKFQKGRKDLMIEIKRLPGKSSSNHSNLRGGKTSMGTHYHPSESNIVDIYSGINRPLNMQQPTRMKRVPSAPRAGPSFAVYYPQRNGIPTIEPVGAVADPLYPRPIFSPHGITPAYITTSDMQFFPVASSPMGNSAPSTHTVEVQPTSCPNQTAEVASPTCPNQTAEVVSPSCPAQNVEVVSTSFSPQVTDADPPSRPMPPVRGESEVWVKEALENLTEMDTFDLDTVFEP
eukprot:CAMPEP_0185022768 /NCGR_PEP_ID=MMETSP1103-20130426/5463_1 /TAXON_ID=36769 /ORGANISM="Paraphysomonas bandaiensis, Strain Caron Lab Isolate" /LENGTH=316 /DNA_ID=CAMNT_0027554991 /DNA_START=83 /DNA_END=1033 /DNA_ORIENTATION=+